MSHIDFKGNILSMISYSRFQNESVIKTMLLLSDLFLLQNEDSK